MADVDVEFTLRDPEHRKTIEFLMAYHAGMSGPGGGVSMISSHNKEAGFLAYLQHLDKFLSQRKPTSEELKHLHEIVTSPSAVRPLSEELRKEMEHALLVTDREDAEAKARVITPRVAELLRTKNRKEQLTREDYGMIADWWRELCEQDTQIVFNPQFRSELRAYGTRKIGGSEEKLIYASHTCDLTDMFGFGGYVAYYGLSTGLDRVYELLCKRYDELAVANKDAPFDKKLQIEAFLQLWGTRVLHPFWDGNGRTFGTHLTLTLEREGVKIRDYLLAASLIENLTEINNSFMQKILSDAEVGPLRGHDHYRIRLDPEFRRAYMTKLGTTMEKGIERGVDADTPYFEHIKSAATAIKNTLLWEGVYEGSPEEMAEIAHIKRMRRLERDEPALYHIEKAKKGRYGNSDEPDTTSAHVAVNWAVRKHVYGDSRNGEFNDKVADALIADTELRQRVREFYRFSNEYRYPYPISREKQFMIMPSKKKSWQQEVIGRAEKLVADLTTAAAPAVEAVRAADEKYKGAPRSVYNLALAGEMLKISPAAVFYHAKNAVAWALRERGEEEVTTRPEYRQIQAVTSLDPPLLSETRLVGDRIKDRWWRRRVADAERCYGLAKSIVERAAEPQ